MTKVEEIILGSTLLIFLALGEAVLTGRLARRDQHDVAMRIDRIARFVYPVLFIALAAVTGTSS